MDAIRFNDTQVQRYRTMVESLQPLSPYIRSKRVLDFGAGYGLSVNALMELGASSVVGVEPDNERVRQGLALLDKGGSLIHVADTRHLPFKSHEFDVVVANAVIEHIPQPRGEYIRELWRVTKDTLIINETPNKYLPWDFHTTKLPLIPWLPKPLARGVAKMLGQHPQGDWDSSGWRGAGHWEIARNIKAGEYVPEMSRARHRVLDALGLPTALLDPYPLWVFKRMQQSA